MLKQGSLGDTFTNMGVTSLKDQLHTLRIWANAARHHDDERWRRDGPANEAEALRLVSAARTALEALER